MFFIEVLLKYIVSPPSTSVAIVICQLLADPFPQTIFSNKSSFTESDKLVYTQKLYE